jgi:CubicO group peptidase (beta-lactamase class C family)
VSIALPRSAPEAQGVTSSGVISFIDAANAQIDCLHGFVLVRHGHVVAEGWWAPYSAQSRHALFSLSKSFTSTAVGLAVADGKLSVDEPVLKFFPDDAPAKPSDNLKAMRVRDLLTMSTGHHAEDIASFPFISDERLTRLFLALPVPHKPGTFFVYNTPATYMQSAIVQAVTGQTVLDYLQPRLFEPLGIEYPVWGQSKQGVSLGGYGLSLRTEDIARFGQLCLQKGRWNGRQLIPAAWVEEATARQVSNGSQPTSDWDQGYGYQFWRCRHGFYRGDGAFGQFCIVMPSLDAVVAINAGTRDMARVMNLVWDKLVPALQSSSPLPADDARAAELKSKLASLTLPMPAGSATSPTGERISGKVFALPGNEHKLDAIALEIGNSNETLVIRAGSGEHRIACGRGTWLKGRSRLASALEVRQVDEGEQPVAACGTWAGPHRYVAKVCFYESPITLTIQLRFGPDFVVVDLDQNVGFGPTTRPAVVGEIN